MFDVHGNLQPGFHDWTIEVAEERLVTAFPESRTRSRIWSGYRTLCEELLAIIDECEHWLDGSFVTAKPHPGDLDLLVVAEKVRVESLTDGELEAFGALTRGKKTKSTYFCDSYPLVRVPETHDDFGDFQARRKYWLGQFGFDRIDRPKGIVRLMIQGPLGP